MAHIIFWQILEGFYYTHRIGFLMMNSYHYHFKSAIKKGRC